MEDKTIEDRLAAAKQMIEDMKIQDAILVLEAEVQENTTNAEAWRILGQLYQENDMDEFAMIAFKNANEADPYDLDSLLCLGISCTNELDEKEAQRCFQNWLQSHPDYS